MSFFGTVFHLKVYEYSTMNLTQSALWSLSDLSFRFSWCHSIASLLGSEYRRKMLQVWASGFTVSSRPVHVLVTVAEFVGYKDDSFCFHLWSPLFFTGTFATPYLLVEEFPCFARTGGGNHDFDLIMPLFAHYYVFCFFLYFHTSNELEWI